MPLKWIVCTLLCNSISCQILTRIQGNEKENTTKNTLSPSYDDYDTNYLDYTDRDYPNLDYHDDNREGRSFNHNYDNSMDDDGRNTDEQDEDFMIRQLKSTIPGTPGVDYALYQSVPETSFRCEKQTSPGFYGDVEAQCQVFHICQEDDRQNSFLCPLGTVFNQIRFICDWWFNFNCEDTPTFYHLNNQFDSSKSMKDTMRRMKRFQGKDMDKIMGLAKADMKIYNMKNTDSTRFSKLPTKNLFLLGIRKKKFENIRNTMSAKHDAENSNTVMPITKSPMALKAMSSTGNFEITLSENITSISLDGFHEQFTPKTIDNSAEVNNGNVPQSTTLSTDFGRPYESLNLSRVEMEMNGNNTSKMKLDHVEITHIGTSSAPEFPSAATDKNVQDRAKTISLHDFNIRKKDNRKHKHDSNLETEYPSLLNTEVSTNESVIDNNIQSNDILEEKSRITNLPLSHVNKFIIGNDTHISVSVTIHSQSGNSKLLWKRLPGLKRIRKIRLKEENATVPFEKDAAIGTLYRKKNDEMKSRSRIMWIPAKMNILDRKMDWKTLFVSANNTDIFKNETKYIEPQKEFEKEALKKIATPPIALVNISYENSGSKVISMENVLPEKLSTVQATNSSEVDFSYVTNSQSFKQYNENDNYNSSNFSNIKIESNDDADTEKNNNCKTICIKLLRSLDRTLSSNIGNISDKIFNFSSSGNSPTENSDEYKREGILDFQPSEQWTLKYDSGPNCSKNTEEDKILVKGWSVIIDVGSLTKERTVKRRSCTNISGDERITLKNFNFQDDLKNKSDVFNTEITQFPLNSNSRLGSADQRYWLNLVKNWLSQSHNVKNRKISKKDDKRISDGNMDLTNFNHQRESSSKELHKKVLSEKDETNFNPKLHLITDSEDTHTKNYVEAAHIPEYNRMRLSNVQHYNSFSDLQAEKSEWSQATQNKDLFDDFLNKRKSNEYNTQDVISAEKEEDRLREMERSSNFKNANRNENSWVSENHNTRKKINKHNEWSSRSNEDSDETYDELSDEEIPLGINRNNNRRDSELHAKLGGWKWSQNRNMKHRMTSPERSIWSSEQNSDWLENKPRNTNKHQNKGFQSDIVDETRDWLFRNRNKQNFRRKNEQPSASWQQDFDLKLSDETHKSRLPNAMSTTKGKSITNEWNTAHNMGKTYSFEVNRRNEWSPTTSYNKDWVVDRNLQRSYDEIPNSQRSKSSLSPSGSRIKHFQTSKNEDSEPTWIMENQKGDKGRKPAVNTTRSGGGWYTEENSWIWKKDNKPLNNDWYLESKPNKKNKVSPDIDMKSGNVPVPSLASKSHQNKGTFDKGKEHSTKAFQKLPRWADDEAATWLDKSPKGDSWSDDHTFHGINIKGNPGSYSERPRIPSKKLRNSNNRDKWSGDEEISMSNLPTQKQDGNVSSKHRMTYPQGRSDFIDSAGWLAANEKHTKTQNMPNNSKGEDFPQRSLSSDNGGIARRKNSVWENKSWKGSITLTRDIKVEDRSLNQPRKNKNNHGKEKTDTASWSMHRQTDSTLSGYGRASHTSNNNNYWGTSKTIKESTAPMSSSLNGNNRGKSAMFQKESALNEGNIDSKKIVWSVQISDDGKLANGWIPITLRPDIKNRENRLHTAMSSKYSSQNDNDWSIKADSLKDERMENKEKSTWDEIWNDEGDFLNKDTWGISNHAKDELYKKRKDQANKRSSAIHNRDRNKRDWSTEESLSSDESINFKDIKRINRNSKFPKKNKNTQIVKHAEITEINPVSIYIPEESFNQLIYIPPKNLRNKRSENRDRIMRIRHRVSRSYIIIKNGKILNGTSKNINRTLKTQSDAIAPSNKEYYKPNETDLNIQKLYLPKQIMQKSFNFDQNKSGNLNTTKTIQSDATYEANDKHGTITTESAIKEIWSSPLLTKNFSVSGWIPVTTFKGFVNENVSDLKKKPEILNFTDFQFKTNKSSLSGLPTIQFTDYFVPNVSLISKDYNAKEKSISDNKIGRNIVNLDNVKEMKIDNKTLRILNFSEVMKQFQDQAKLVEHHNHEQKLSNKPIQINSKVYSLNPSKESNNFSNSWFFSPKENVTKNPFVLLTSGDNVDKNENHYNKITGSASGSLSNSTVTFSENKTHSDNIPEFKYINWNANSDWIPIIKTTGRVVNRTL